MFEEKERIKNTFERIDQAMRSWDVLCPYEKDKVYFKDSDFVRFLARLEGEQLYMLESNPQCYIDYTSGVARMRMVVFP